MDFSNMKFIYWAYCIFLLVFCSFWALLALASPHSLDRPYMYILIGSSISFLATAIVIMIRLTSRLPINAWLAGFLISSNILAFGYYAFELIYKDDSSNVMKYSPVVGILFSILVLVFWGKYKALHHQSHVNN